MCKLVNLYLIPVLVGAGLAGCGNAASDNAAQTSSQPISEAAQPVKSQADISTTLSGTYVQDSNHAYLMFSYDHNGFSRPVLRFEDFDVTLQLDSQNPESSTVDVEIDISSVDTGSAAFDEHIVAARWLDVAQFPTAHFVSTKLTQASPSTGALTGDLKIRGITKPITLDVVFKKTGEHRNGTPMIGMSASGTLLRSEFGVPGGTPAISDEVLIQIEMEMFLQQN